MKSGKNSYYLIHSDGLDILVYSPDNSHFLHHNNGSWGQDMELSSLNRNIPAHDNLWTILFMYYTVVLGFKSDICWQIINVTVLSSCIVNTLLIFCSIRKYLSCIGHFVVSLSYNLVAVDKINSYFFIVFKKLNR